jgi:hypothetical protein
MPEVRGQVQIRGWLRTHGLREVQWVSEVMESQAEEQDQVWRQTVKVLMERGLSQRDAVIAADYTLECLRVQEQQNV